MGLPQAPVSVKQFPHEEGDGFYNVWRVDYPEATYVLKQAKGKEAEIYKRYLNAPCKFAPLCIEETIFSNQHYLLLEYVPGHNITNCSREDLIPVLDSMIAMQSKFWGAKMEGNALQSRFTRGKYLADTRLERAYFAYLEDCEQIPAALCHDDLLPFNVVLSDSRAVFIDWEVGGILPYPTSLARLLAHSEEQGNPLFFMKESDKSFALSYFYTQFLQNRGVAYDSYLHSMDLALFYEYCEWVYVGNKYHDTQNERFRKYYQKATDMAIKLGF